MRNIPHKLLRDWRIRTLIPVLLINLAAFAALYFFMYHFAVSNLIRTEKAAGAVLLDEIELTFPDMMRHQTGATLRTRIAREAAMHNLVDLNVFAAQSQPVICTYGEPSPQIARAVGQAMASDAIETHWIISRGERTLLVGIRPLANRAECHSCHLDSVPRLGALQMSVDLTTPMKNASDRVRSRFLLAGGAWLALLALMFWTGGVVIGRPLKRIQRSIAPDDEKAQDLEALATSVHQTIWALIERQRQRENDIIRQMAHTKQLAVLGELAAGLTHEIKNPLAGVIAALEVVHAETRSELVEQMLAELKRVTTTLDSLLRLARPQPPQRSEVDLARSVRDLSSIFQARFRRSGVDLHVQTAESVPRIPLDQAMMAQLVVNLLTNSLQATDRGGKVSVHVAPFPRGDGVLLVVSDTGCGIAEHDMQKIFDPFFTTKEEGTGLGMAICRQIVTQHGGTISIESEVGKGTRVIVLLPDTRAQREQEENDGLAAAG